MILILGGTTEGRLAVQVVDQSNQPFYYSTKGTDQHVVSSSGIPIRGGMDATQMKTFCEQHNIRLLIDAAHPFAVHLHQVVSETAQALFIPVVRLERIYPPRDERLIWCDSYEEAIKQLEQKKVDRLLALTGVQTIGKLKPYWSKHPECHFRILQRQGSLDLAQQEGFPQNRLCFYTHPHDEQKLLDELQPQAILTKESGLSGGFSEKIEAAQEKNLLIFVIKRPLLPQHFYTVYGEYGLRKAIEQRLPTFFPLHIGYTTGACATAATKAALQALLSEERSTTVTFTLPNGEEMGMPIQAITRTENGGMTCTVIKEAGDDPDITNGLAIQSTVSLHPIKAEGQIAKREEIITIKGGEGVGTVTLPGLGLPIGSSAINQTPQRMIKENLWPLIEQYALYEHRIEVCIEVPKGKEIAQRTFNPRLGIIDGLSIIGTSGIVRPFSSEAFIHSIKKEMEVAKAIGTTHLVLNSGAKSERYVKGLYPNLPAQAFIHYGNFIGESLKLANELAIEKVSLGIMIGKAIKLAEGYLDTHSKKVVMNKAFVRHLLTEIESSPELLDQIDRLNMARELWELIPSDRLSLFCDLLIKRCDEVCSPLLPCGKLEVILIHEDGHCYTQSHSSPNEENVEPET